MTTGLLNSPEALKDGFDKVDERFNEVDAQFEKVEGKMEAGFEKSDQRLETAIEKSDQRLEKGIEKLGQQNKEAEARLEARMDRRVRSPRRPLRLAVARARAAERGHPR